MESKTGDRRLILGVTKGEVPSFIGETERFRKLGLPNEYVVVENCDEWMCCLDTSKMKGDECPVGDWDRKGNSMVRFDNFELYICERLEAALEKIGISIN